MFNWKFNKFFNWCIIIHNINKKIIVLGIILSFFITNLFFLQKSIAYFSNWNYDFENEIENSMGLDIDFIDEYKSSGGVTILIIRENPDDLEDLTINQYDNSVLYYVFGTHYILSHSYIAEDFIFSYNFKKIDQSPDTTKQRSHLVLRDSDGHQLIMARYNQELNGVNEGIQYYDGLNLKIYLTDVEEIWHKISFHVYLSNNTYDFYYDEGLVESNLDLHTNWNLQAIEYIDFYTEYDKYIEMFFDDFSFETFDEPFTMMNIKEYPLYSYDFENEYVTNLNENITFAYDFQTSFGSDSYFKINYDMENVGYGDKKLQGYREEVSWSEIKHNIYNYTKFLSDFSYSFSFCQETALQGENQLTRFTIENNYGFVLSSIMFYSNTTWRGFNIYESYYNTYFPYDYNDNEYYNIEVYQFLSQDLYHIFVNGEYLYTASTIDAYYGDYIGYFTIDNIQSSAEYYFWIDNFVINSLVPPPFFYIINPTLIEAMIYMFVVFFIFYIPSIAISKLDIEDDIKEKINLLSILFMGIILVSVGLIALWNMLVLVICFIAIAIEEVKN